VHTKIEYKLLNIGTVREYFLLLTLSILRLQCRLQLDMRNLRLGRRHLVHAYEVEASIGVIAGNTV